MPDTHNQPADLQAHKHRIYLVAVLMVGIGAVLVGQLIRWQIVEHHVFVAMAEAEHQDELVIPPRRGEIRDASGYLLAAEVMEYDISASPKIISNPAKTAARLAPLLDKSEDELLSLIRGGATWVPLVNGASRTVGETIMEWDIVGLKAEPSTKRIYPESDLGAHFIGFVNGNGYGFYGVEGYYDTMLRGRPGYYRGERTPFGDIIPMAGADFTPPVSGPTLQLTINRSVQHFVEAELQRSVGMYRAQGGTIVVLNPKTGAVIAMANYPSYNLNQYAVTDERLFTNGITSEQYEPGSIFKMITMAAGLDANVVLPETTLYDGGSLEVGGPVIYNWDRQAHGMVDMTDILAQSLNVGVAQVAVALSPERFYTYVKRFGFGRLTEIDLSNEGPGTLKTPQDATWHQSDLAANSYGQGIAVTPIQMAASVGAIANDGLLMKPYIVQRITDAERDVEVKPTVVRRAISEHTARTLTDMLVESLDMSGSEARLNGYQVAGKTGTAEIPIPGGYHPTLTIASFVGYLPADDPQLAILVTIDRPTTSRWGGKTAAPTFRRLAQQLTILLDIPPDDIRLASVNE